MRPDTLHIASMSGKKEKNIERMLVALPSISSYQMKKVSFNFVMVKNEHCFLDNT